MKAIAGTVLILASSGYAVAGAILMSSANPFANRDGPTFGFIAFALLFLGIFFLIFFRDKPDA